MTAPPQDPWQDTRTAPAPPAPPLENSKANQPAPPALPRPRAKSNGSAEGLQTYTRDLRSKPSPRAMLASSFDRSKLAHIILHPRLRQRAHTMAADTSSLLHSTSARRQMAHTEQSPYHSPRSLDSRSTHTAQNTRALRAQTQPPRHTTGSSSL